MLYLWYHPWYQAFYVGYQYRIGIEASDYISISIVSVSKFQVLESISIVSVSNIRTLEVSVSYRYRKKRYRRALSHCIQLERKLHVVSALKNHVTLVLKLYSKAIQMPFILDSWFWFTDNRIYWGLEFSQKMLNLEKQLHIIPGGTFLL